MEFEVFLEGNTKLPVVLVRENDTSVAFKGSKVWVGLVRTGLEHVRNPSALF